MPRKKKVTGSAAKSEAEVKKPLTVACPLKGHRHELALVPNPDAPDLLLAYCGGVAVVQTPNPRFHRQRVLSSDQPYPGYVIPGTNSEEGA